MPKSATDNLSANHLHDTRIYTANTVIHDNTNDVAKESHDGPRSQGRA